MKLLFSFLAFFLPFFLLAQIDTEPTNNTLTGADALVLGVSNNASIGTAGDKDHFKFTVSRSCIILYKVQNVPSTIRLEGLLIDPNDIPINNSGHYEAQGIGYTWETKVCQPGEYKLKLIARDGNSSSELYKVTISY